MNYSKSSPLLAILCILVGCTSAPEEAITGLWSVDAITTQRENIKSCFLSNVLNFKADGTCSLFKTLPEDCPLLKATTDYGNWNFDERSMQLLVNSQNPFFNKKYHVYFVDDTLKQMLVMRLTTFDDTIICRKGLYEYDKRAIANLVNQSIH